MWQVQNPCHDIGGHRSSLRIQNPQARRAARRVKPCPPKCHQHLYRFVKQKRREPCRVPDRLSPDRSGDGITSQLQLRSRRPAQLVIMILFETCSEQAKQAARRTFADRYQQVHTGKSPCSRTDYPVGIAAQHDKQSNQQTVDAWVGKRLQQEIFQRSAPEPCLAQRWIAAHPCTNACREFVIPHESNTAGERRCALDRPKAEEADRSPRVAKIKAASESLSRIFNDRDACGVKFWRFADRRNRAIELSNKADACVMPATGFKNGTGRWCEGKRIDVHGYEPQTMRLSNLRHALDIDRRRHDRGAFRQTQFGKYCIKQRTYRQADDGIATGPEVFDTPGGVGRALCPDGRAESA